MHHRSNCDRWNSNTGDKITASFGVGKTFLNRKQETLKIIQENTNKSTSLKDDLKSKKAKHRVGEDICNTCIQITFRIYKKLL